MFERFSARLRSFFSGRYGADALGRALLIFAVVLMVLGSLGRRLVSGDFEILSLLAFAPLIWGIFRMYSRNFEKRRQENAAYLRTLARLKDRSNRYYRCPHCRQLVRVPRGKGRIKISCPTCHGQFIKKT